MENEVLFYERQRFRQWWLWIILMLLSLQFIIALVTQVFFGEPFGDKPASDLIIIIATLLVLAITVFMKIQVLTTKVDEKGIYIKYSPIHRRWRHYPWNNISHCEVKRYRPVMDYGGWGIRQGAYSMSGKDGMLITFKNRVTLMIGTRKPEELKEVLQKLEKLKQ